MSVSDWTDDARRLDALRAAGVAASTTATAYVRVRHGEAAIVAFLVDGRPAYVRLDLRPNAEKATAALVRKWETLRPAEAPEGFGKGVRALPDGRGALFFFPNDAGLRGLRRTLDPDDLKRELNGWESVRSRGLRFKATGAALRILRWKPEQRLVAAADLTARHDASGAKLRFEFVVRASADDRGRRLDRVARALSAAVLPPPTPEPLGVSADGRLYVERRMPGRPLSELLREGAIGRPEDAALALRRLHDAPVPADFAPYDCAAAAESAVQQIRAADPALGFAAAEARDAALRLLPTAGTPTFLHGDLHPGQIVASDEGVALVDFERAACGDAALDLGHFLAELRVVEAERPDVAATVRRFADRFRTAYAQGTDACDEARLRGAVAIGLLRRAELPFRRAEPGASASAAQLVGAARRTVGLESGGEPVSTIRATGAPSTLDVAYGAPELGEIYARPGKDGPWPCSFARRGRVVAHGLFEPESGVARIVAPEDDPRLPRLCDVAARGELLARRVGGRALVREVGDDGVRYLKALPKARVGRVAAAHDAAAASVAGDAAGRMPRFAPLLGADAEAGLVVTGELPGVPLSTLLRGGGAAAVHGLRRAAAALAAWHRAPEVGGAPPAPAFPTLAAWRDLASRYARTGRRPLAVDDGCADLVRRFDAAPPSGATALSHGDLHDGNVFVPESGPVGFLDLDLLHRGDAATDVGNLAAHAALRTLEAGPGRESEALDLAVATTAAYAAEGGPAPAAAVRERLLAALLRLSYVYVFRRARPELCSDLAALARRAAEDRLLVAPA